MYSLQYVQARLRAAWTRLAAYRRTLGAMLDLRDVIVFSGLGSIFYGLWQIYPPIAWIVSGTALFWLGMRK